MADSLTSFATLFAPVLMLSDVELPVTKRLRSSYYPNISAWMESRSSRPFELRAGGTRPLTQADSLLAAYLTQIERVIEAVNRLPVDTSKPDCGHGTTMQ